MSIFAATVVVLIWLFASWSAPAAQLLLSASTGARTTDRCGLDHGWGGQHLLFAAALQGRKSCCEAVADFSRRPMF